MKSIAGMTSSAAEPAAEPRARPAGADATAPAMEGKLREACVLAGSQLLLWTAVAAGLNAAFPLVLTARLFWTQDLLWLVLSGLLLMLLPRLALPLRAPALADRMMPWLRRPAVAALALTAVAAAAVAVTYALTRGFHLSRDEMMADFDAGIFRSGHLVAMLPPFWRPLSLALVPDFLRAVPGNAALVSSYLPGNAALRALVGLVASPDWTSPLLAGLSVLALFRIARRLWPEQTEPVVVAALMLTTSSQMLLTASTSYAMTAHMAVNLVWLWLFLRDDRAGHAGAMAAGFVGCGLHQIVFHPLFAAPFILRLWLQRRRGLASVYVAAYAAIGMFWIAWPGFVLAGIAAPADHTVLAAGPHFLDQLGRLLATFDAGTNLQLTLDNLLRFAAWQNLLLLPLLIASVAAVRRGEGLARPLLAGLLLTTLLPFIVMPWQGHGWGYRYLHSCLGSVALLAGYGWLQLTGGLEAGPRRAARGALGIAAAFSLLVLLPARIAQMRALEAPFRAAEAAIRRAPADVVIVDPTGMQFANDLVRNDPFLRNRPKVLELTYLDADAIRAVCARFSVAVFDKRQGYALGIPHLPARLVRFAPVLAPQRGLLRRLGCGTPVHLGASGG